MMDTGVATTQQKPGPSLAVSLLILVLGAALAVVGGVEGVTKIVHAVTSPVEVAPANLHRHLSSGTYEIYTDEDVLATISPSQVTVTASNGTRIPVTDTFGVTETLTRNSHSYLGQVRFKVPNSGDYDVAVSGPDGVQFILSNSLGDLAKHAIVWFALLGIGILIAILGAILWIVGAARRHRWRNPRPPAYLTQPAYQAQPQYQTQAAYQPVAATPAPGWYPDPSIPGTSRWWDGTRWTDQTSGP
jgi:hypothetical protein